MSLKNLYNDAQLYAFLLGASAITIQIVLLREFMAVFYGNELCVGLFLAGWMLWIAAGSWAGNFLKKFDLTGGKFLALQLLTFALALVSILATKLVRILLHIPYGEFISFSDLVIFSIFILAIPCFLLGLQFSLLARSFALQKSLSGDPSAFVYILESLGSVVASVAISVLLLRWFTNIQCLLILAVLGSFSIAIPGRIRWGYFVGFFLVILLASPLPRKIESSFMQIYWHSVDKNMHPLAWKNSRYGELVVLDWGGENIFYANSLKQTVLPDKIGSQTLASLVMNEHPDPKSVLLIEGGLGGLADELARYPGSQVDYLELDVDAYKLTQAFLDTLIVQKNLKNVFADGRRYLHAGKSKKYDLIIINAGRPTCAASNRYYTREFFQLAVQRLSENGILAILNFPSSENYLGTELLQLNAALYKTLKMQFADVLVIPGDQAIFLACKKQGVLTRDAALPARRYTERGMQCQYFYPQVFAQYFQPERLAFIKNTLEKASFRRINRDFAPISYYFDFVLWNKIVRGENPLFLKIAHLKFKTIFSVLSFFLILALLLLKMKRRTNATRARVTIWVTIFIGFAGITFNFLLILAFQTVFGYVYEWIGLAMAAFMFGLALAGYLINKNLDRIKALSGLKIILTLVLLTAIGFLPLLKSMVRTHSYFLYFALVIWSGSLIGGAFPLLCKLYQNYSPGRHPGSIYAADLIGGSAGSLLVSGFFVPLFGFTQTCGLVVLLLFFALSATFLLREKHDVLKV
ncbi:MAG: hypothetical protein GXO75_01430 [Calditrichaeota bacterium]|nr:hypothetical protein [Calditrichota bacterium]